MKLLRSGGSWKAHLHHKCSALYQAEHSNSVYLVAEWSSISRFLWLSLAVTGIGLADDGKLFQGFCSFQTQVSRLERTLHVSLRSQIPWHLFVKDLSRLLTCYHPCNSPQDTSVHLAPTNYCKTFSLQTGTPFLPTNVDLDKCLKDTEVLNVFF